MFTERFYDRLDAEIGLKHLKVPYMPRRDLIRDCFGIIGKILNRPDRLKDAIREYTPLENPSGEHACKWLVKRIEAEEEIIYKNLGRALCGESSDRPLF